MTLPCGFGGAASADTPHREGAPAVHVPPPSSFALIAAVARNGVIGSRNGLPWRLPEDLAHFRALTMGHAVIMGRTTWESLPRALPGRQNIVVTRQADYRAPHAEIVPALDDALARAAPPLPAFCIGGGELYRLALPRADTLYLTEIDRDFDGDVTFPPIDSHAWREVAREPRRLEGAEGFDYAFVTYRRASI
jgi:dihydrofolate reductase